MIQIWKIMAKNSKTSPFDISRPPKSGGLTHSTPEIEFDKLKEKVMLVYRNFTTGQKDAYIRSKLNYIPGRNISTPFWNQMNSALAHYYNNLFSWQQKARLEREFEYITWVVDRAVDIPYDECGHSIPYDKYGDSFLSFNDEKIVESIYFYLNSDKNEFCNFIELSFRLEVISKVLDETGKNKLVGAINEIFSLYNSQLELTPFVYGHEDLSCPSQNRNVLEYPRVISKVEPFMHEQAIEPTLSVLREPHFQEANSAFLNALKDYRNENFSGCITKCGSALESVLIILCNKCEISFPKKRPSVTERIKPIVRHLALDEFLAPALEVIPKLRNKFSDAHGRGEEVVNISPHIAEYTVNCTASAILLLVNEYNNHLPCQTVSFMQ